MLPVLSTPCSLLESNPLISTLPLPPRYDDDDDDEDAFSLVHIVYCLSLLLEIKAFSGSGRGTVSTALEVPVSV